MANGIRSVSQTVQEREIIKTCPDVVIYFEGLPYLINRYISNPQGQPYTLVNFNDHVSSFNSEYDTDLMIPTASINLQVPNHMRYVYQMPGGNNLLATMMQVQVYAKGYYMSAQGDTVYRRVFKGMVSHVGYNDNGKTLEISIQCYGILYMLELMQINLNPAIQTAIATGSEVTIWETIFADHNPYRVIADAFTYGLQSDGFQLDSYFETSVGENSNPYSQAVQRGYIAKWQAILFNMAKDLHVYGSSFKDNPTTESSDIAKQTAKESTVKNNPDKNTLAHSPTRNATVSESYDIENVTYLRKIAGYLPFTTITALNAINNAIVNRLELIRRMINIIGFEGYQDVDGKIIVKPPLYNLDVLNLGVRSQQTSTIPPFGSSNSQQNPLTQIYPDSNPFVVHLSEILSEQETEDQSAIRRTRTVVRGCQDPKQVQVDLDSTVKPTAEYIDITKLAKFGLREEPAYTIPWYTLGDMEGLFATAIFDTVKANRAYRTYTVTIPLRPELKLGFPIFFPHKDMYGYIKKISLQYNIGGTATMTVMCDSLRRRVLINTPQTTNDNPPRKYDAWTSAPDLVYKWSSNPQSPSQASFTQLNQSPNSTTNFGIPTVELIASGGLHAKQNNSNFTNPVGTSVSLFNVNPNTQLSPQQLTVKSFYTQTMGSKIGTQTDTSFANWVIANDTGYFKTQPPKGVEYEYLQNIRGKVIPFTDYKGYEVLAPFPWGRYVDLNTAIHEITEMGWVNGVTDVNGNQIQNLQDLAILQSTDAFLFAGLGTPTATSDTVSQLSQALQAQQTLVGGNQSANNPTTSQQNNTAQANLTMDATVIVLKYNGTSANDSNLLSTSQPEDSLVYTLIQQTQTSFQQTIDVLVSGGAAPPIGIQEALLATKTQTPTKLISLNPKPRGS